MRAYQQWSWFSHKGCKGVDSTPDEREFEEDFMVYQIRDVNFVIRHINMHLCGI